ncbi:LysR family transcriptional regulator [Vibrio sonorensis]|uniref:LysR family transcriptional regulator n=1 Tax=Vibrio sonorensis TaxID=1004316 RepID=UPI0009FE0DE7|nr:LysR family transcriptional regulator [Vibrio sonorensis]
MNNYKLLPALNALLFTQNVTEAAKLLNVSQPAMSKTLNQIREAFGDDILVKQGKGFCLTKRGKQLKLALPSLLEQVDQLYQTPDYQPQNSQRRFQVALDSFVKADSIVQLTHQLSDLAPNCSLHVTQWQESRLVDLSSSDLDLVAVMAREIPDYLYGQHLGSDHYVVVGDSEYWSRSHTLKLTEYLASEHLLVSGLTNETRQVDTVFKQHGKKRKIAASVPNFDIAAACIIDSQKVMTVLHTLQIIYKQNSH